MGTGRITASGSQANAVRQSAAVCPQTGNSAGLLAPKLNTNTVNAFFQQLSLEIAPDVHVIMIWDQAGYHTSELLKPPANLTLISLPPKSPELNPIENLWHYLRSHHWSNRAYEDYNALEIAACDAWHKSCLNPELMKTVCAVPWLEPRS